MVDIINYLREFPMGLFTSTRRVQRVRHDLRLREVEVVGLDGGHHLHMEQPVAAAAALAPFLRGER